jgi:MYXO-CTERM domain-containing protein
VTLLALLGTAEAACGDRVLDDVEECDDGNLVSGDGCSDRCIVEDGWACETRDFELTQDLDLPDDLGLAEPAWFFREDRRLTTQLTDGGPSVFLSDVRVEEGLAAFGLRVNDNDRDFVGFTVGLEPGAGADADWLLIDWKGDDEQASCGWAAEGLAISRVQGLPSASDLWCHQGAVTELAGGSTLANSGWRQDETYVIEVLADSDAIQVWVDGSLELDYGASLPMGSLGVYTLSQQEATFELFQPLQVDICSDEGSVGGYTGGLCTGCASGPAGPAGLLGMLALGLLRRRR